MQLELRAALDENSDANRGSTHAFDSLSEQLGRQFSVENGSNCESRQTSLDLVVERLEDLLCEEPIERLG